MPRVTILKNVLSDRGSKYAVAGGPAASREEAEALVAELKRHKKFAKATHNSWAALLPEGPVKQDDGEGGAGMVILNCLEGAGVENHVVIVTRWFGGTHLGGDRFRHVKTATQVYLDQLGGT